MTCVSCTGVVLPRQLLINSFTIILQPRRARGRLSAVAVTTTFVIRSLIYFIMLCACVSIEVPPEYTAIRAV